MYVPIAVTSERGVKNPSDSSDSELLKPLLLDEDVESDRAGGGGRVCV